MGVYEVAGELISGFQSNYEKSPPRPQALMSWRSAARTVAMEVAATLLPKVAVSWNGAPLHYAATRGRPPGSVEHVIALFASAVPHAMTVSYEATVSGWALVPLSTIMDAGTRARTLLAVQLAADIYGDGRLGEPGGAIEGLIGVHDYAGVGTSGAAQNGGQKLFQSRQQRDEAQTNELRSAISDETRRQAALGDLDMAGYLDEKIGLVRAAPAEDVGVAARGAARHAAPWLVYEPFRDIVTHPSEPLPAPTAQRVSVGPPPRAAKPT